MRDDDGAASTHDLVRSRPHRIARMGVARSFQNIELFSHLTLLENLMLGRHVHMSHRLAPAMLWFGPARRQEVRHREFVEEIIDLLQLQAYRHHHVGSLAYGIQKRVELGRALAIEPSLLLLDEPMAGMNAEEKEDMARYILDVSELRGVSDETGLCRNGSSRESSPFWSATSRAPRVGRVGGGWLLAFAVARFAEHTARATSSTWSCEIVSDPTTAAVPG